MRIPLAFRSLGRARVLSIGVAATLAAGIGALTITYAVVDAAVVRQPPFPDALASPGNAGGARIIVECPRFDPFHP